MRTLPVSLAFVICVIVAVATGARAQSPGACVFPPVALPGDDGIPDQFISTSVFVTSPPPNAEHVPLNVEVRLGGVVGALAEPAQFELQLLDDVGARVPYERRGGSVRPLTDLRPDADYLLRVAPTDQNTCPQCFTPQEVPFHTGVAVDTEAPVFDITPDVFVFALPSLAEQQRCGLFTNATHQLVVDFGPHLPLDAWISVAARHEQEEPAFAGEGYNNGNIFSIVTKASDLPTALGDRFLVAFTARDLAGNESPAKVVAVRARSFRDAAIPRAEMSDLTCDVAEELTVRVPDSLPTNGRLLVEFPFEEVPLSLAPIPWDGDEDALVALVAVEDTHAGHIFQPGSPLAADTAYEVVTRACPNCVCTGCLVESDAEIIVGSAPDQRAPSEPRMVELREDASPSISTDTCEPDRPAIIVVLKPGDDDTTDALSLRYAATVKIEDGVSYALGSGHTGAMAGDGTVEVRLETPGLPRLLGESFDLTLEVEDAAGNRTRTVIHNDPEADALTCGAARERTRGSLAGGAFGAIAIAAVLVRPRRPRG